MTRVETKKKKKKNHPGRSGTEMERSEAICRAEVYKYNPFSFLGF